MEYTITKNAEFDSLEVRFDEKPADTVRLAMKRLKMRWHGVNKCWYGYASESAIVSAILENAPEEQPATVYTDGYMGGGAVYGSAVPARPSLLPSVIPCKRNLYSLCSESAPVGDPQLQHGDGGADGQDVSLYSHERRAE